MHIYMYGIDSEESVCIYIHIFDIYTYIRDDSDASVLYIYTSIVYMCTYLTDSYEFVSTFPYTFDI